MIYAKFIKKSLVYLLVFTAIFGGAVYCSWRILRLLVSEKNFVATYSNERLGSLSTSTSVLLNDVIVDSGIDISGIATINDSKMESLFAGELKMHKSVVNDVVRVYGPSKIDNSVIGVVVSTGEVKLLDTEVFELLESFGNKIELVNSKVKRVVVKSKGEKIPEIYLVNTIVNENITFEEENQGKIFSDDKSQINGKISGGKVIN